MGYELRVSPFVLPVAANVGLLNAVKAFSLVVRTHGRVDTDPLLCYAR